MSENRMLLDSEADTASKIAQNLRYHARCDRAEAERHEQTAADLRRKASINESLAEYAEKAYGDGNSQ